jgi:hypothetical protein
MPEPHCPLPLHVSTYGKLLNVQLLRIIRVTYESIGMARESYFSIIRCDPDSSILFALHPRQSIESFRREIIVEILVVRFREEIFSIGKHRAFLKDSAFLAMRVEIAAAFGLPSVRAIRSRR